MLAQVVLLGLVAARGEPLAPQPHPPPASRGGVDLVLAGGLDSWPEEQPGTVEAGFGGAFAWTRGPVAWSARYGAVLQGWQEGYWVDAHLAEIGVDASRHRWLGGLAQVRGSALWGWSEALLGASARAGRGAFQARLGLGPDLRSGNGWRSGGLAAEGEARLRLHPRVALGTSASLRSWWAADFPTLWGDLDIGAEFGLGSHFQVATGVGCTGGRGGAEDAWVAGLTPSGLTTLRAWITPGLSLGRGFSVQLPVSAERAGEDYQRVRALVALQARLGRAAGRSPELVAAPRVTFALHAPDAARVELSGSFAGWSPLPMERWPDGTWVLVLDLPPGEHAYSYLVDGVPTTPPEALRHRPDGFGGEDGILLIEGEELERPSP